MTAKGSPAWNRVPNGSRSLTPSGYVRVKAPGHPQAASHGWAPEHRLVLFDAGVEIDGNHVHHINGDKTDNRIANLEVIDIVAHAHKHLGEIVTNQHGSVRRDATHCLHGHSWAENTGYRDGYRRCLACHRERERRAKRWRNQ